LQSLKKFHPTPDYEIIIVSNSPLSAGDKLKVDQNSHSCKWIQMQVNAGYGRACNKGGAESSGEFIFFLNPDTVFLNDALAILKKEVEAYNYKAIVGPATFDTDLQRIPSVKNRVTSGWMFNWLFPFVGKVFPGANTYNTKNFKSTSEVEIINGSAIFMHRTAFEEIGGFSNDYFMYWEENDLCMTLKERGFVILYSPKAKIIHSAGHSTKNYFIPMEIEKHRSQKIFLKKYHPYLFFFNRIFGILAYFWRTFLSFLLFRLHKAKQFHSLLIWYLFRYK
ncbi:MAG: glycosyltransferase, partial [Balneolaceae bacterium]